MSAHNHCASCNAGHYLAGTGCQATPPDTLSRVSQSAWPTVAECLPVSLHSLARLHFPNNSGLLQWHPFGSLCHDVCCSVVFKQDVLGHVSEELVPHHCCTLPPS